MFPTLQGRSGVNGILASAGFYLPLYDSGSGAVNTTLSRGVGSATFTRTTEAACRLSTGLWKLDVAAGVARSHYWEFSAGTMTYGGYLAEPAATQILTAPRDMTNVAWTAGATITAAQDGTGIDGVANSCTRLTGGAVEATNTVLQTITAAASSRTYSAFIKRVTGTGAIGICQDGVTFTDISAELNSTSFVQVQLNASQLNAVIGIQVSVDGDVILVDCNQFEAGAIATTPIPAAGSRAVDVLTYTFSGNATAAAGTAYAEVATLWSTSELSAVAVGFGSNLQYAIGNTVADASTVCRCRDGTNSIAKSALTNMTTGVRKRASSWGSGIVVTGDGATAATGSFDGDIGSSGIGIGIEGDGVGSSRIGTLKNVRIWTAQLPNQQLQAVTS